MNKKIPYMDLSKNCYEDYENAIKKVFAHGQFILGPEVREFEEKVAAFCNIPYALTVGSGTDSLYVALKALDIKYGDEVIIPNISFVATANAVKMTGAEVKFCDVQEDFTLDPLKIEKLIHSKTKAIIIVHYGGKIAQVEEIKKIADRHNLKLIEDAAQAFGAKKGNKYAGSFSDVGCFSLNPMKPLGAFGEAGLILIRDKILYDKMNMIRCNGVDANKTVQVIGCNAKIDTLQAAILLEKLKRVERDIERRIEIARIYSAELEGLVKTPSKSLQNDRNVYFTYTILTEKRDTLLKYLLEHGIEAKVYHTAISLDKPYEKLHHNDLEMSVFLSKRKLALPCNNSISNEDVFYIIETIKRFFI